MKRTAMAARGRAAIAGLVVALGCEADAALAPPACDPPEIVGASIGPNAHNVLSAIVGVSARHATSAAAAFVDIGEGTEYRTPFSTLAQETVQLPLLGLHPETDYEVRVVATSDCATVTSAPLAFRTEPLPDDLPPFSASGADPSPGYVVLAAGKYGLVIDNTGRVVWYHEFPEGPGLNFQAQPNGHYVARPAPVTGERAEWVELDVLGRVTRRLGCARDLPARMHDLIAQADGSYWVMCDEVRSLDGPEGFPSPLRVTGTVVQHITAEGMLRFEWNPFDHFAFDVREVHPADISGAAVNWTHGNAIDLHPDGSLLVSFRNLNEITKIDVTTGAVIWRLGGRWNQFRLDEVAMPPFARQHGVRASGAGSLLVLDNLGEEGPSRAERYELDEARLAGRLAAAYTSSAGAVALLGGSTQELGGGRVLVSYGNGASVEEYAASGAVVWRLDGNPGYLFRAQRIRSLYAPGVGEPR